VILTDRGFRGAYGVFGLLDRIDQWGVIQVTWVVAAHPYVAAMLCATSSMRRSSSACISVLKHRTVRPRDTSARVTFGALESPALMYPTLITAGSIAGTLRATIVCNAIT
jgi:hypothetical protein